MHFEPLLVTFALVLSLAARATPSSTFLTLDLRTSSEPASPIRAGTTPRRSKSLPADLSKPIDSSPLVSPLSTPPSTPPTSPKLASQPPSPKLPPNTRPAFMVTPPAKKGWKAWFQGERNPASVLKHTDYERDGKVKNPAKTHPKAYRHFGLHNDPTPGSDLPFLRKHGYGNQPKHVKAGTDGASSSSGGTSAEGSLFRRPKQKRNPAYWLRRAASAAARKNRKHLAQEFS